MCVASCATPSSAWPFARTTTGWTRSPRGSPGASAILTLGGHMQHVIRYEGGYERNFGTLRSQGSEYEGDDGGRHIAQPWPKTMDGVRFSFMEQPGKRFVAVRVQYAGEDV